MSSQVATSSGNEFTGRRAAAGPDSTSGPVRPEVVHNNAAYTATELANVAGRCGQWKQWSWQWTTSMAHPAVHRLHFESQVRRRLSGFLTRAMIEGD